MLQMIRDLIAHKAYANTMMLEAAQCAKMLRRLGGTPPMTDFILWCSKS